MSRNGIMLCYPFEEKRLLKWKPPYIVQPKYDGERCRAIPIGGGKYMLLSSQENPFFSVPHIVEYLSTLQLNVELDGELYCHGLSFEDIHSRVSRTVNLHSDYGCIKYHIFDYVSEEPQVIRMDVLTNMPLESNCTTIAPYYVCWNLEDIMRRYDLLLNKGYEGIIVRHLEAPYVRKRSVYMMKFKPKKEDIYEIIGYKEEVSKDGIFKDRLGALTCTGDDGTVFSVGSGLNDEDRQTLWDSRELLKGKRVRVQYQHLTSGKKVPRFPVFVEILDKPILDGTGMCPGRW